MGRFAVLKDRLVHSAVAASVIAVGVVALCWPVSLELYDRWGFQIICGSGLSGDYTQADTSGNVAECRSAIWTRRAWAGSLAVLGAAGMVALMPGVRRGAVETVTNSE